MAPGTLLPTQGDVSHLSEPIQPRVLFWKDARTATPYAALKHAVVSEGFRSALNVPLQSEGALLGFLGLYFDQPRDVLDEEKSGLLTTANLATLAIENARLYGREKEASRRLDRLQELALRISSGSNLDDILFTITKSTVEMLRGSHSRIYLFDQEKSLLRCRAYYGIPPGSVGDLPGVDPGIGLGGWVFKQGESVIVEDVQKDPRWLDTAWAKAEGLHSFIGVPLRLPGETFGIFNCLSQSPNQFDESDLRLLESLAGHAVAAIEKARALQATKLHSERQEALRRITQQLTQNIDPPLLFSRICQSVHEFLEVDLAHLLVVDPMTKGLDTAATSGKLEYDELGSRHFPLRKGLAGQVYMRKEAVAVREVLKDPDWMDREWAEKNGIKSFLGIPLRLEGEVVGILDCFTREIHEFQPDEIGLMQDFADQAAIALKNARAFEEVTRKSSQIERLNEINRRLSSLTNLEDVLEAILEVPRELIGGARLASSWRTMRRGH